MTVMLQVRELRNGIQPLRNWDTGMQLYYDETNNVRKLSLSEVGPNVLANGLFIIAGIATLTGLPESSEKSLRNILKIHIELRGRGKELISKNKWYPR